MTFPSQSADRSTVPTRSPRRAISSGVVTITSLLTGKCASAHRMRIATRRATAGLKSRQVARPNVSAIRSRTACQSRSVSLPMISNPDDSTMLKYERYADG